MTPLGIPGVLRRRVGRAVVLRYLALLAVMSLAWEFAHMPLYTIGQSGSRREIVLAGLHCTLGDIMIGAVALALALLAVGPAEWPRDGRVRVLVAATAFGLGYTVFSEWLNVELREAWAYSEAMPRLPGLGTGLSPLLQWLLLPPAAYLLSVRCLGLRRTRIPAGSCRPVRSGRTSEPRMPEKGGAA